MYVATPSTGTSLVFAGGGVYNHSYTSSSYGLKDIKNGDKFVLNYSNYRYTPTIVAGVGNSYEGKETTYYIYGMDAELKDSTNLAGYHLDPPSRYADNPPNLSQQRCYGVIYEIISYYDFMMTHYYVPVPKGLWYRYNGQDLRIPDNGLFDLLTGTFYRNFRKEDASLSKYSGYRSYDGTTRDGKEFIFLRNQQISESGAYDLFNGWEYETTDVSIIKRITENTIGYQQPDEYSIQMRDLTAGLILPITKQTDDSQNQVVGSWDKSCDEWIKRDKLETISGYNSIVAEEATYSLVPGTISNFYVYNDPLAVNSIGEHSDYSYGSAPGVIKVYYECPTTVGGMLFDGAHWIPRAYTSSATTPLNKNYVITQDTNYYKFPIADNEYRINSYLYGERITVLYVCQNNTNWGYTGQGWIEIDGNTSEVL